MNNLTVQDFLDNRDAYLANGRNPLGNEAQRAAREDALVAKVQELRGQGLSRSEAQTQAGEWMSTQAALHDPDQIAGGFADRVTGMGDSNVNSSIGSQWRTRIGALDDHIRGFGETLTPAQRASTYLDVTLSR